MVDDIIWGLFLHYPSAGSMLVLHFKSVNITIWEMQKHRIRCTDTHNSHSGNTWSSFGIISAQSNEKLSLVAQLVLDLLVLVHLQKLKHTDQISIII